MPPPAPATSPTEANLNGLPDEPLHESVYREIRRNLIAGQFSARR